MQEYRVIEVIQVWLKHRHVFARQAPNLARQKKPILHYRKNKDERVASVDAVNLRSGDLRHVNKQKMLCKAMKIILRDYSVIYGGARRRWKWPNFQLCRLLRRAWSVRVCECERTINVYAMCVFTHSAISLCLAHLIDLSKTKNIYFVAR